MNIHHIWLFDSPPTLPSHSCTFVCRSQYNCAAAMVLPGPDEKAISEMQHCSNYNHLASTHHPDGYLGGEQRGSDGCWCRAFQAEINKKISPRVEPLPREELSFIFLPKSVAMVVTTSCTLLPPHWPVSTSSTLLMRWIGNMLNLLNTINGQ